MLLEWLVDRNNLITNRELNCEKCTNLWLRSAGNHFDNEQFFIDFAVEKCSIESTVNGRTELKGYV